MEKIGVYLFYISVVKFRYVFVECFLNVCQSFWGFGLETDVFVVNKYFILK